MMVDITEYLYHLIKKTLDYMMISIMRMTIMRMKKVEHLFFPFANAASVEHKIEVLPRL